jgi:chemotaxis protein methyltransferase CheR
LQRLFSEVEDARTFAQMIVDTVREPLLVLDPDFKILFASSSFLRTFDIPSYATDDISLFALQNGRWDIPDLRALVERCLNGPNSVEDCEFTHDFSGIGKRVMRVHIHRMAGKADARPLMLLEFEDVTTRRAIEDEKEALKLRADELVAHRQVLMEEMQHRIANSLQIIASVLLLKARAVNSEETREHLRDAHRRVMSIAAVQKYLEASGRADQIEIGPYLTKLCASLAQSMIGDTSSATLKVEADDGSMISGDAVSLGLIVTELVINALKYAFPRQPPNAAVLVRYEVNDKAWRLSVSDNGIGNSEDDGPVKGGLGTSLVNALANQLHAEVESLSGPSGMSITITSASFVSRFPRAA